MYALSDYDYTLPPELIAQQPAQQRDQARLMIMERRSGTLHHRRFAELPRMLTSRDLLVINNTRVVPARLFGRKATGGRVEVLILDYAGGLERLATEGAFSAECLVKASKKPKPGAQFHFSEDLCAEVVSSTEESHFLRFSSRGSFEKVLQQIGAIPLPPYIKRDVSGERSRDREDYQTVYAACDGAVAAPTAGLHFTRELMDALADKGIPVVPLTLHVGYGTFLPVRVDDIRAHRMHAERFRLAPQTAETINRHKAQGGRIVAVGTTSVRTLEYACDAQGRLRALEGHNDLYIYPGYRFRMVDAMITNFHLPQSTLLMLVSAFAGRDAVLAAYREAVRRGYRFFSYGDGMLIG
jgi:S-adenosylmethionine:tRNA ribosyltransferase-isomerase